MTATKTAKPATTAAVDNLRAELKQIQSLAVDVALAEDSACGSFREMPSLAGSSVTRRRTGSTRRHRGGQVGGSFSFTGAFLESWSTKVEGKLK